VIEPAERVAAACERRAARAEELQKGDAPGREPLRFAAGLFRAQAQVVRGLSDLDSVTRAAEPLLRYAAEAGPALLAADAREALAGGFPGRVRAYWEGAPDFDYLARAALSPYAQLLRERGVGAGRLPGTCTTCGGGAWVASRRSGSSADGAMRMLHCALCAAEWQVGRILCPGCGEQDPAKLPTFSAPEHIGARVEACESCRGYVKSLDLTLDARRIPEVDDLLSISMDLWAAEQGFQRLEPGLAGL
jgi:formate dehydrogenase maturation protein FdhE